MSKDNHLQALADIAGPAAVNSEDSLPTWMLPDVGIVSPGRVSEVQEIVKYCASERLSVGVAGAGTASFRSSRPDNLSVLVSTLRLNQLTDFQPDDLVLAAEPGFTGAQAIELLTPRNLLLTLDPPRFQRATLGGIAAARSSGPARFSLGTPRDLLIGATVVNSAGEITKTGGKVVKNVSGYDLCKLYSGSYGTLGILVETVWRLSPRPDISQALVARMPDWKAADRLVESIFDSDLLPRSIDALNGFAASQLLDDVEENALYLVIVFDGNQEQAASQVSITEKLACDSGATAEKITVLDAGWNSEFHTKLASSCHPSGESTLLEIAGLSSQIPEIAGIIEGLSSSKAQIPAISAHAGNGIVRALYNSLPSDRLQELRLQLKDFAYQNPSLRVALFDWRGASNEDTWISDTHGLEVMRRIRTNLDPNGLFAGGRYTGGL